MRLARTIAAMTVALVAACGLVACSGNSGRITLDFPSWQASEPGYQQFYTAMVKQFEASHPNVKIHFYEVTYDNFIQSMVIRLSANKAPDILPLPVANYAEFASQGVLANLDDDVAKTDIVQAWGSGQKSMRIDGHYYGVLAQAAGYVLYVNKKLLAAKHLPIPTTVPQLLSESKQLTGNGTFGVAMPTAQDPNIVSYASAFVAGNGDQLVKNNKYNLTDPKVVADIEQYRQLAKYAAPGLISEQARQIYNAGKAAFLIDGIFELPAIAAASKSVYADTVMARFPTPRQITKLSSSLQIPSSLSPQRKKLAWEFIQQVATTKSQVLFAKDTQNPAPRIAANPLVQPPIPFAGVQSASNSGINIVPNVEWFQRNYDEIGNDFGTAMTTLFTGNSSAASVLADMQKKLPAPGQD